MGFIPCQVESSDLTDLGEQCVQLPGGNLRTVSAAENADQVHPDHPVEPLANRVDVRDQNDLREPVGQAPEEVEPSP